MTQTTIGQIIVCEGVGLHSGKTVRLELRPAAENTGILFHVNTSSGMQTVSPRPDIVVDTGLATTLGTGEAKVSTVEHLLAAIRGLGIDNIHIFPQGGEIPILDGSAAPFVALFKDAGIVRQSAPRVVYRVKAPVSFSRDGKSIEAFPYAGFAVDYTIKFSHPQIGTQRMVLDVTPKAFAKIASARTFGFLHEIEYLRSKGLACGGSLENAIVLDQNAVLNPEGLRFHNEFVRHKLLDFVGDMGMLDRPLQGRFIVSCSGHALNNEFLRKITAESAKYLELVSHPELLPQQARHAGRSRASRGLVAQPASAA